MNFEPANDNARAIALSLTVELGLSVAYMATRALLGVRGDDMGEALDVLARFLGEGELGAVSA